VAEVREAEVQEAEEQEAEELEPVAQVAVQGLAAEELALAADRAALVVELVRAVEAGLAMVAVAEWALALAAEEVEAE
jgi:hypothetical protein